ncbi:MAG: helix-turn-helix domain-containing protein [Myxococcales bacterium]|nr:helix-turn-helix domain-containing protein [Myxococcales bacterium]
MELSIKEAADIIGKSERTVRHMAQTGRLRARRIGSRWVINRADLEDIGKKGKRRKAAPSAPAEPPRTAHPETVPVAETLPPTEPRPDLSGALPRPSFTVSFEPAPPPAEPGSRDYPNTIRELDAFAIATTILSGIAEARRDPRADQTLLEEPEEALRTFLQLLTDGVHQPDLRRKEALFQRAQSKACAALSSLIHYNLVYPDPDFSRLAERIETHLLMSLQELREATHRRLTWRGRVITAAEIAIERLLEQARAITRGRLTERLNTFERSVHRALQHAL